jgi:hypothetical protein
MRKPMALWKIEIYEKATDTDSTKVGYVEAATECDAIEIAGSAMKNASRADILRVLATKIVFGFMIWVK